MKVLQAGICAVLLGLGGIAVLAAGDQNMKFEKATVAGGCFWCIEAPFDKVPGVISAVSGYTGGQEKNPSYKQVSSGMTGHLEAVQITFDPEKISYEEILNIFWRQFDPTDAGGSFYDRGTQYTSAIFYHDETQREIAVASKQALEVSAAFDKPIVTPIREAETFYPAEDYHQDYWKKNPGHYQSYRRGSGRDRFIEKVWGKMGASMKKSSMKKGSMENSMEMNSMKKGSMEMNSMDKGSMETDSMQKASMEKSSMDKGSMDKGSMNKGSMDKSSMETDSMQKASMEKSSMEMNSMDKGSMKQYSKPGDEELRKKLNKMQYYVTQEEGTEPPFQNEFWNQKKAGIYVDIVSGEPLFSSTDKYRSGTGWPSFTRPLVPEHVVEKKDMTLGMTRTEVRSKHGNSHLGHVFNDGPAPTGLRYCINSASLRFVPKENLEKEGFGEFMSLFK